VAPRHGRGERCPSFREGTATGLRGFLGEVIVTNREKRYSGSSTNLKGGSTNKSGGGTEDANFWVTVLEVDTTNEQTLLQVERWVALKNERSRQGRRSFCVRCMKREEKQDAPGHTKKIVDGLTKNQDGGKKKQPDQLNGERLLHTRVGNSSIQLT